MNLYKTLCELEISTQSESCHYIGAGTYDYTISQHLSFETIPRVFMGAKDVRLPENVEFIEYKILLTKKASSFDPALMEKHSFGYRSYEELCTLLQTHANQSLAESPSICLPFLEHEPHRCIDATVLPYTVSFEYRFNRFILNVHNDLMLVVSRNVADLLNFLPAEAMDADHIVYRKKAYVSEHYCNWIPNRRRKLHFVVYDLIREYRVLSDGSRYPILFSYDRTAKYKSYDLLGVKELVKREEVKQFRFCILDEKMSVFECDPETYRDISFTLVFLTF